MKHALLVLFLAVTSLGVSAQQDSLDAKIERLLTLSGAEQNFLSAVENMLTMQRQQAGSGLPDEWFDEFSEEIRAEGWQQIAPKLMEIYRSNLTEEQIDHQLAYLADPITQQIVAKQPLIMQQSMAAGQEWGMTMGTRINQRIEERKQKE